MKRTILLLGLFALLTAGLHAQNMRAFISHKAYCTPAKQPYIEFSFIIGGESVQYAPDGQGHYFAEVEIQVDVVKDDSVVTGLHYILTSDLFADSAKASTICRWTTGITTCTSRSRTCTATLWS